MKIFSLYQIKNQVNEKIYIGVTLNPKQRFSQHISDIKRKSNHPLYCDMKKYGIEKFSFEIILESKFVDYISTMEKQFIRELNPVYNVLPGGYRNRKSSDNKFKNVDKKQQSNEIISKSSQLEKQYDIIFNMMFEYVLGKNHFEKLFYEAMLSSIKNSNQS